MKVRKNERQRRLPKQALGSRCSVYLAGGSGFARSCFIHGFKRANLNLQVKNFNESDEKRTAKT